MPSMVTRPVITSMANAIRLHWRRVVAVTWGWKQWKSATISTIGALRCGVGVVVLYNATLHDNGPPYLIFGEGIVRYHCVCGTISMSPAARCLSAAGTACLNEFRASSSLRGSQMTH